MKPPAYKSLAALVVAATLVLPAAGHAQLGGLMKKAKEKAAEQIDKKTDGTAQQSGAMQPAGSCGYVPTFDNVTIELNAANLDKVAKALQAVRTAGEKNGRNALAARVQADRARLEELDNDPSLREAENSRHEWESCRNETFQEIINKRIQDKGMGLSPEYMKAMREHQEKIAAAEQRGDVNGAKALQDSTWYAISKVVAPTPQDSAAVNAKCGKPPRASRRAAERDSLQRTVREMSDSVRVLDEDAEDQIRSASGLTPRQVAAARERLEAYLKSGRACGFTKTEVDAINPRKAELEKLI